VEVGYKGFGWGGGGDGGAVREGLVGGEVVRWGWCTDGGFSYLYV